MITTRKKGRVAAVSAVIAGLVLGTALTASAEPTEPLPFPQEGETGSLTITKLADPSWIETLDRGDGRNLEDVPDDQLPEGVTREHGKLLFEGAGVKGVSFRAERVAVDLTTHLGWQAVEGWLADSDGGVSQASQHLSGEVFRGFTDGDGVLTLELMPIGLYLVTEENTNVPNVIQSEHPFLVTIPMTHPKDLDHWMYDVHVYPKNADTTTVKTVNDEAAAFLGDYVEFDITMTVPRNSIELTFTDVLDERLDLTLQDLDFFWIVGMDGDEPILKDYSSQLGDADFNEDSRTLVVGFNEAFLSNHVGDVIGFRIRAQVVGLSDGTSIGDGVIENKAGYKIVTSGGWTEGESDPVETRWGTLGVIKISSQDNKGRGGAEFCLARTKEEALNRTCATGVETSRPDGSLEFIVRRSDFANGNETKNLQVYWLVEMKAPENHELIAKPIPVMLKGDGLQVPYTIKNYPSNGGFPLPEIGGNRAVLPILAAVVAAGGVVFLIRSRRQQEQKA